MDFISLSKVNRLYWLGRYYERVSLSLQYMMRCYDAMIDTDSFDYDSYCCQLGIPNDYQDVEAFFQSYIFDVDNPYSIRNAAEQMLGNGMVLREAIGTRTLAYLQMAVYSLDEGAGAGAVGLKLLQVLDNIMAFRGSYDSYIVDDSIRNTIKCGASVERMSYCLRTGYRKECLPDEVQKFLKRLQRTNLHTGGLQFQSIVRQNRIYEGKNVSDELSEADFLQAVENVVIV